MVEGGKSTPKSGVCFDSLEQKWNRIVRVSQGVSWKAYCSLYSTFRVLDR